MHFLEGVKRRVYGTLSMRVKAKSGAWRIGCGVVVCLLHEKVFLAFGSCLRKSEKPGARMGPASAVAQAGDLSSYFT